MALWEDLNVSSNERRWLIVGDFNSLLTAEEQCGYNSFNAAGSRDFQNSLSTSELVDLGYEGTTFTWCRGRGFNNLKMARLDRALCSTNWRMAFSEAKVIRPVRLHSDHIPVIIDMRPHKSTPKLGFRFQLAWIPHKGFSDVVKHNWQKGVSIIEAAKGIGGSLSEWNRNVFGNIFAEKKILLKRLKGVHRVLALRRQPNLFKLEFNLRQKLENILIQEEMYWFQMAREDSIVSGEQNTKFYHLATTVKKKAYVYSQLKNTEGDWVEDKEQLKNMTRIFFEKLYTREGVFNLDVWIRILVLSYLVRRSLN